MIPPASTDRVRENLRRRLYDVTRRRNGLKVRREDLLTELVEVQESLASSAREEEALKAEVEFHARRRVA